MLAELRCSVSSIVLGGTPTSDDIAHGDRTNLLEVNDRHNNSTRINTAGASSTMAVDPTGDASAPCPKDPSMSISGAPEDFGELAPFVFVGCNHERRAGDRLARYDPGIDIPLPRSHSDVVRTRAAKSAEGIRRVGLYSSEVGAVPFTNPRHPLPVNYVDIYVAYTSKYAYICVSAKDTSYVPTAANSCSIKHCRRVGYVVVESWA